MHKLLIPLALAAALLGASPAWAHGEIPVAGVVAAVTATTLEINMKDGKTVTLQMDANTRVEMAGKKLRLTDIKVGQSVKALGFGDSLSDLVALDVTITVPGQGG
ncbi:MAG: DUF5666 domain-containing protein [Hyphomonadaceae bacterium]|nr:DUF5666 domain-containing protein [Hyphomonadaceae bacterium]